MLLAALAAIQSSCIGRVVGVAAGSINTSDSEKRRFAADSARWNKSHAQGGVRFKDALPILRYIPDGRLSAEAQAQAVRQRYPEQHAQAAAAKAPAPSSGSQPAKQPLSEKTIASQPVSQVAAMPKAAITPSKQHQQAADAARHAPPAKASTQASPGKLARKRPASSDIVVLDEALPAKRAATQVARPAVPVGSDTIDLT